MSEHPIGGIDIHTYLVKEPDRAKAFWRDTMGLKMIWDHELGAEFELPDGATFGLWKMEDRDWTPGSGIMFAVDDVPAAVEYYTAKGVTFEGQDETPVCWMGFAKDSEGNRFILHKRK